MYPPSPPKKKKEKRKKSFKVLFPSRLLSQHRNWNSSTSRRGISEINWYPRWHGSFLRENETVRLICELQGTDWHAFNTKLKRLRENTTRIWGGGMQREFIRECLFFATKKHFRTRQISYIQWAASTLSRLREEDTTMRILWKSALDREASMLNFYLWNRNTWRNWNESCLFSRGTFKNFSNKGRKRGEESFVVALINRDIPSL